MSDRGLTYRLQRWQPLIPIALVVMLAILLFVWSFTNQPALH